MQNQKGINWSAWGLFIICLGQALYIYTSIPGNPEPTHVVSVTKVGDRGAIYEIFYGSGGATVPYIYRYFLMELQHTDADALNMSEKMAPFLVTKSTEAVREVLGDRVKLKSDETIYDFHNVGYFKVDGKLNIVKFDLNSISP